MIKKVVFIFDQETDEDKNLRVSLIINIKTDLDFCELSEKMQSVVIPILEKGNGAFDGGGDDESLDYSNYEFLEEDWSKDVCLEKVKELSSVILETTSKVVDVVSHKIKSKWEDVT